MARNARANGAGLGRGLFVRSLLLLALAEARPGLVVRQAPPPISPVPAAPAAALLDELARGGVHLDAAAGWLSIRCAVVVRGDLLEYLLVGPAGRAHESLFVTDVKPSLINAGLLALGAAPGRNARWIAVEPAPTSEERAAGAPAYRVEPPSGDGFYLHAAWREGDASYCFRVEDLLCNLASGRSMTRHRWVYLGSRFVRLRSSGEEAFAADLEQDLVNVAFFPEGHTLLTAGLDECLDQTIWTANAWLLPERGSEVELVFARQPLGAIPESLESRLPIVARADISGGAGGVAGGR
jgi:hypothetical protein